MRFQVHSKYDDPVFWRWHEFYPIDDPRATPPLPAVYVIYWNSEVVYVGSTINLEKRMRQHVSSKWMRPPAGCEVTAKFRGCNKFGEWLMLEARLIRRLKPRFNSKGVLSVA